MFKHYETYFWKDGKPYGAKETAQDGSPSSYKIVVDPYYKRFSIEKYQFAFFEKIIYDSNLLDLRHLTIKDQMAWQREVLNEEPDSSRCLLRDQNDRAILYEALTFEKELCRSCVTSSVHGVPIAVHRMYYSQLDDPFNGVVLFDIENRPVMMKVYEIDPITNEFTHLISEEWNMQNIPELIQLCLN